MEYSTKTEFDSSDWKGTASWNGSAAEARSVRLRIYDDTAALIPAGSTLSVQFICQIDDLNAQPGQIAWNSFGYHYSLVGEAAELEAAPLKVGVKIPSVPELKKQIVDHSGKPMTVTKDETFSFLVYPGKALTGSFDTEKDLTDALEEQGISYEKHTVTVKEGESLSEPVRLDTTKWTWVKGNSYTVTELPRTDDEYAFYRFPGAAGASYTFSYDPAQTKIITCENTSQRWKIALTKVNTEEEALSGAVFALYSPVEDDQISIPDEYAQLDIQTTLEYSGKTWYLAAVGTTGEDGKLEWENLLWENYYLLEVKAPEGYILDETAGQLVEQKNEVQGDCELTVVNRRSYVLPKTGGAGTSLYQLGGIVLMAGVLMYPIQKRRKGAVR